MSIAMLLMPYRYEINLQVTPYPSDPICIYHHHPRSALFIRR